jgi:hypothetical protein
VFGPFVVLSLLETGTPCPTGNLRCGVSGEDLSYGIFETNDIRCGSIVRGQLWTDDKISWQPESACALKHVFQI